MEFTMPGKETFETVYSKEDPYRYRNSISDRTRRAILLKHIGVIFRDGSKKTILDAGCGEGYISRDVASNYNADVDAFDISDNALVTARKRNSHANINYFQLDFDDFSPNKKYDLILCEEALYYLDNDNRISTIRKFHDALKVNGHLRLTSIIIGETLAEKFFTPETVQELVARNGFQIVSIWPSVINKSIVEKVLYRLLEYMNKLRPVGPNLIDYFVNLTLNRPLSKCRAISLLAKKV
jgi:2-polyprenyl-3-methyl-5-hydroxy-6-metoxy-1,4-benzoquinol methylase